MVQYWLPSPINQTMAKRHPTSSLKLQKKCSMPLPVGLNPCGTPTSALSHQPKRFERPRPVKVGLGCHSSTNSYLSCGNLSNSDKWCWCCSECIIVLRMVDSELTSSSPPPTPPPPNTHTHTHTPPLIRIMASRRPTHVGHKALRQFCRDLNLFIQSGIFAGWSNFVMPFFGESSSFHTL